VTAATAVAAAAAAAVVNRMVRHMHTPLVAGMNPANLLDEQPFYSF
jgi:hypothetical protein